MDYYNWKKFYKIEKNSDGKIFRLQKISDVIIYTDFLSEIKAFKTFSLCFENRKFADLKAESSFIDNRVFILGLWNKKIKK